jgi:hypothetical protein
MTMKKIFPLALAILIRTIPVFSQENPLVTADFPAGNILVERMEGDTIWMGPDLSETEGEWFYWHFKLTHMAGRTLHFQFTRDNQFSSFGPAYSINHRDNWKWLGEHRVKDNRFSYSFSPEDTVAWFCTAIPYAGEDLEKFLGRLRNRPFLVQDTLCISPENRVIEQLHIRPPGNQPEARVLITARHHACEMMASYVLEGIMESILNERDLQSLRDRVEFRI